MIALYFNDFLRRRHVNAVTADGGFGVMLARLFGTGPRTGRRAGARADLGLRRHEACYDKTNARLAGDRSRPVIAGVIEERSEQEDVRLVPVVSGGCRDGDDTLQVTRLNQDQTASEAPAKTLESGLR